MASPIQVVLNPENYQEVRETSGGGGRKDFFAHRDAEFRAHRSSLISQIDTISGVLSAQSQGDVGYPERRFTEGVGRLPRKDWASLPPP